MNRLTVEPFHYSTPYSTSWHEKLSQGDRENLLACVNVHDYRFEDNGHELIVDQSGLSQNQIMVIYFAINPMEPINFANLDLNARKMVLRYLNEMHHE